MGVLLTRVRACPGGELVETSCRNACHGSKRRRARIEGLTGGLEKEKMHIKLL
jgi:hypothetical protein